MHTDKRPIRRNASFCQGSLLPHGDHYGYVILAVLLTANVIGMSQYKFDNDCFIISTAYFDSKKTDINLNGDFNVYVTSADSAEKQTKIQIEQRQDIGHETLFKTWTLNELYQQVDGNGLLLKGTPLAKSTITVTDMGNASSNAVLFFIKKEMDEAPVYDATNSAISIQSDAQWAWKASAVTFLNAKPFFTLSNFSIGTAANLRVYATPCYLTYSDKYYQLIDIRQKEYAANSFVPIIGPIATVSMVKFDITKSSFSVSSDTKDWFSSPFSPGSQISISSPGFISMSRASYLPHFFSSNRLIGDWKASRDAALTVDVDTINLARKFKLKFLAGAGNTTENVGTSEKLFLSAMEFQLDNNISNPYALYSGTLSHSHVANSASKKFWQRFFVAALLSALAAAITKTEFDSGDSFVITTADSAKTSTTFSLEYAHNLYVTSAESDDFNAEILITKEISGQRPETQTLKDVYKLDSDGLLRPTELLAQTNITVVDNSGRQGQAVLLFFRKSLDYWPVYDATKKPLSVVSDEKRPALGEKSATFLSAAPFFTLHDFVFDNAKNLAVYATPNHMIGQKDMLPLIDIPYRNKEYAANSFATIIGPVATVRAPDGVATFSVKCDTSSKWLNGSFTPGSQISISSPGLISIGRTDLLPHFFPYNRMIGYWKATRDQWQLARVSLGYTTVLSYPHCRFLIQITSGGGEQTVKYLTNVGIRNILASGIATLALVVTWLQASAI